MSSNKDKLTLRALDVQGTRTRSSQTVQVETATFQNCTPGFQKNTYLENIDFFSSSIQCENEPKRTYYGEIFVSYQVTLSSKFYSHSLCSKTIISIEVFKKGFATFWGRANLINLPYLKNQFEQMRELSIMRREGRP